MKSFALTASLSLVLLLGCATAQVQGFRDPSAVDKTYASVVILYPTEDFNIRAKVETMAMENFNKSNIKATSSLIIYNPSTGFNENEFYDVATGKGFEAALLISKAQSASKTNYATVSNYSGNSNYNYNANAFGGGGTINGTHSGSAYTQLIENTQYFSSAQVELWDLKTKTRVWMGSVNGASGHYSSYDGMLEKMIETTKEELLKASLIRP